MSGSRFVYWKQNSGSSVLYTAGCLAWGALIQIFPGVVAGSCYRDCAAVTEIDVGNYGFTTDAGGYYFAGCTNLRRFTRTATSASQVGSDGAFMNCPNLNYLKFGSWTGGTSGTLIPDDWFTNCGIYGGVIDCPNASNFIKAIRNKNSGWAVNWGVYTPVA
jgi:hypothetical protein